MELYLKMSALVTNLLVCGQPSRAELCGLSTLGELNLWCAHNSFFVKNEDERVTTNQKKKRSRRRLEARTHKLLCRAYLLHFIFVKILSCDGYCNVTSIIFEKIFSAMAHCTVKSIDSIKYIFCNGTL